MTSSPRTHGPPSSPYGHAPRGRPRWGTLALVTLLHLAALAGLVQAFAPEFPAAAIQRVGSLVTVTVTTPPEPPETAPAPTEQPPVAEGAASAEAPQAVPREVVAPPVPIARPLPAPRAASTGSADQAGAASQGAGTGADGAGEGTGSGASGTGRGGVAVTRPEKIAGDIRSAADYPVPAGGRQTRFGQSVTIAMTVGVDGRASNCRVIAASNDPAADRITCELAIERFRFQPARDANGNPVAATYGWRQDFFAQR